MLVAANGNKLSSGLAMTTGIAKPVRMMTIKDQQEKNQGVNLGSASGDGDN